MRKYFPLVIVAAVALFHLPAGAAHARGGARSGQPIEPPVTGDRGLWQGEIGTASYYGPGQDGRRSASGVRFDQQLLTAAHPWLPFGTKIRVTLGGTERFIIVTVTDRLRSSRRVLDLSLAAARELGILRRGIAMVTLAPI